MSYYTDANYYDLLEVEPRASQIEIEEAYRKQVELLSGNSLATYGLFVGHDVDAVRERVEQAYHILSDPRTRREYDLKEFDHSVVPPDGRPARAAPGEAATKEDAGREKQAAASAAGEARPGDAASPPVAPPSRPAPEAAPERLDDYDGPSMRAVRERKGISLEHVSARTKISEYYLSDIEADRFEALPPAIYLRAYLRQYAEAIGVDVDEAVKHYMARVNAV